MTIFKILEIWFKDNIIVKLFRKSFIALIFIRVSTRWNNIYLINNDIYFINDEISIFKIQNKENVSMK